MAVLPVVIYAAKSTTDEKGSIPQQVEDCKAHAEAFGWFVDSIEQDEAASACTGNRGPGLERAMARAEALAKQHGRAGLLLWKSNRLARGELTGSNDARHLIDYFRWADRSGVELLSVTDAATFTNSIVAFVVGEMNAAESKAKSDAVRRALRHKRKQGIHVYGDVYGYDRDPDVGLKRNAETAAVVERIFQMVANGTSQAEVVRVLTAEGVPTARAAKSGWTQGQVSRMLQRRTYLGEVPADDPRDRASKDVPESWGPGLHEALVSEDLWDAAQAANARRAKRVGKGGGRPSKAGHLLTGFMLHHIDCGRAMTPRSGDPKKRDGGTVSGWYVCSGRKGGACDGLTVPMQAVDDAVIGYLSEVGLDAELTLRLLTDATASRRKASADELAGANRELAKLAEQHARLWQGFRDGDVDADDWRTFKAEHADEKAALDAKVAQLEARAAADAAAPVVVPAVADALALVRDFITNGDTAAVRNVVGALFDDFLIGEIDEAADVNVLLPAAPPADLRAARATLPDAAAIEQANLAALAEDAALGVPEPMPSDDAAGLLTEGLWILPQPRREALQSVMTDDGPALLVDEHGRSLFRRLPVRTTYADGLTT